MHGGAPWTWTIPGGRSHPQEAGPAAARGGVQMQVRSLTMLCLMLYAVASGVQAAEWALSPDGRIVTVTTTTLRAVFENGTMVALENLTGGDGLFVAKPESQAAPALRDAKGFSSVDSGTQVTCEKTAEGVRMVMRGTAGDASARITLEVGAGADGALTVREWAEREAPEVLAASWGVAGIDAARTHIIAPANGGTRIDALRGPGALTLSWPGNWQAALVLVEGEKGGFSVSAEDPEALFKSVHLQRTGHKVALTFGAESRDAYEEARSVVSPVWRIQAYRGDWKVPALEYRERMAKTLGLTPIATRSPAWLREVRLVVRVSNDVTAEHLRGLAAQVDPTQTLLYVPGWRKHPYDVLYPDYTPREGFVEWCRAAQALGFRVMPHFNLVGVNVSSPELPKVERYLQRDRVSGELVGWYLDRPDSPNQVVCLNPASSVARRFLIEHIRAAWEEVRFDAMHLDFPVIISTHEGDIEGMTCARGAQVYLRELQAAIPDVPIGAEGLNEAILASSVAQCGEPFWVNPGPGTQVHPIRSFLFAPFCGLYGHLGIPSQATSLPAHLNHHDFLDRMGGWPTLSLDGPLDPANAGTDFVLREARYFQQHRLVPAPEEVRWPEELFTWRGADGTVSAVFDTPPGRRLAPRSAPDQPAWMLLSKVNTYDGPGTVAEWRAFDGARLFGLDPQRRYPIVAGAPDPKVLHLVSASGPIILEEVRDNQRRALFRLAGQTAVVADLIELAGSAAAGILVNGRQEPLSAGAGFFTSQGVSGGEAMAVIFAHPPWEGTTLGGLTYGEFPVTIPAQGKTVLRFAIGLRDLEDPALIEANREKPLSDGVTFTLSVDGQELFREHWLRGSWARREVDLSTYRGRSIILRLTTGPGPAKDCSWDWAIWGEPRLINLGDDDAEPVRLRLFSPAGAGRAFFGDTDSPGRVVGATPGEDGVLLDVELPRPQPFGLLHDLTPAAEGADLAELPFTTGWTSGGLLHEGSVWNSGTVGTAEIAGSQVRTIFGHPPESGRTALDWCLQLPPEPLRLRFHVQVRKGGGPVAFEVQVNGQRVWGLPMPSPDGWKAAVVDLAPWAGKPILLSLVTDSCGSALCDWAEWGDPHLEAP